jgi:putative DNA primase/helicase
MAMPPEISAIVAALGGHATGSGYMAHCPAHNDATPSLSISVRNGRTLFHCHAGCQPADVIAALRQRGLRTTETTAAPKLGSPVATYDYKRPNGELAYQVCKYLEPEKTFRQRRPDGDGWIWKQSAEPLPYRLPELLAANSRNPVFIPEGEKDCNNLAKLGLVATTNHGGAKKWKKDISCWFKGYDVVILPDNDDVGREHAQDVAKKLKGIAKRIRVLELPGLPEKGEVSDWVAGGGTAEESLKLAKEAPDWTPGQSKAPEVEAERNSKPTIRITGGSLSQNATDAESALIAANLDIFQRRADWVRPVIEKVQAAHGRDTYVPQLVPIEETYLRDLLCRHAKWEKYSMREKEWYSTNPTPEIAKTILARRGEWRLRHVTAILSTPTMRPDGSIISLPGYYPETRFILVEPPAMPHIEPTRDNAIEALALLDKLLAEFPFVSAADRSVALSALITPVVRGAFPTAPMHVVTAPVAGSGKSYLLDSVSALATGHLMPVMAAGRTEEETEKRIGAALLAAQPLISIDNVNGLLGGDCLCQAVERQIVNVRVLGRSERVQVEPRGTSFFATGNNIQIHGDMTRHAIRCTLDPRVERPELRQFSGNPVQTVLEDRGKYIAACFTIIQAYIEAGSPNPATPPSAKASNLRSMASGKGHP